MGKIIIRLVAVVLFVFAVLFDGIIYLPFSIIRWVITGREIGYPPCTIFQTNKIIYGTLKRND